ncbi:hypothetical protein BVX95_02365 [archaeon D22]|nr:hypothetical protein BVX95_02365 [archaeon D22]
MIQEYCADIVALYKDKLVVVERLSFPAGLALPGGRRDIVDDGLESVTDCALREFKEETGLDLEIDGRLGVYDEKGRDPRGPKSSEVVYGNASGIIRDEPGKTKVLLLGLSEIDNYRNKFAFDHYQIISDYKMLSRK